jgi:hypothetical protein
MLENWIPIPKASNYLLSTLGNVESRKTGQPITSSQNQQGVEKITLYQDKHYLTMSVALLVAQTFLPDPPRDDFTTPIQLDGDRSNCRVDNLMWRPRWFAVRYHQERRNEPFPNWTRPFEIIDTNEVFYHPRDCAVIYGLLEGTDLGIHNAILNEKCIFPTGFSLQYI